MENLIFSLNATVPVFLLMVLGIFFHRMGWIDDTFASQMNRFVLRCLCLFCCSATWRRWILSRYGM